MPWHCIWKLLCSSSLSPPPSLLLSLSLAVSLLLARSLLSSLSPSLSPSLSLSLSLYLSLSLSPSVSLPKALNSLSVPVARPHSLLLWLSFHPALHKRCWKFEVTLLKSAARTGLRTCIEAPIQKLVKPLLHPPRTL